jgi:hypothetical protein
MDQGESSMWVESVNALLLYSGHHEELHWYHLLIAIALLIPALAILRVRDRRRERRWKQHLEDIKTGKIPVPSLEDAKNGTISLQATGFTVVGPVRRRKDNTAGVTWDEVEEIRAFKQDLLSVDRICWGFCCRGNDSMVVVNEEMLGFKELQKAVESRFGVKEEDWFRRVAFPAFAPNMTVIWPRDKETPDSVRS